MKIGDLVKVLRGWDDHAATDFYGLVTEISPATLVFPRELVTVTFPCGEVLEDLPARWVERQ